MTSCSLMNVAFARPKWIIGMLAHAALIENPIFLSLAGAQDQATHRGGSCFWTGKFLLLIPHTDEKQMPMTLVRQFFE
jgi:hypothetical protein